MDWKIRQGADMCLERTCLSFPRPWVTSGVGRACTFLSNTNGSRGAIIMVLLEVTANFYLPQVWEDLVSQRKKTVGGLSCRSVRESIWVQLLLLSHILTHVGNSFLMPLALFFYTSFQPQGLCSSSLALSYSSISSHYSLFKWDTQE